MQAPLCTSSVRGNCEAVSLSQVPNYSEDKSMGVACTFGILCETHVCCDNSWPPNLTLYLVLKPVFIAPQNYTAPNFEYSKINNPEFLIHLALPGRYLAVVAGFGLAISLCIFIFINLVF
jgi:hypothetical protein